MRILYAFFPLLISYNLFSADSFEIERLYKCFSVKDIKVNVEYEDVQWTPNEKPQRMCIFSFNVTNNGVYKIYLTRRWRSPNYCKKLINEWKDLEKQTDRKVCISGYISDPEREKVNGKEILQAIGYWEVIKSGDWCHTYFVGNCQGAANATESF